MSRQLPLALHLRHAPSLDDFIVGANRPVIDALSRAHDDDGEPLIYLSGPPGCGRTHLLTGQCASAARVGRRCAYLPLVDADGLDAGMLDGLEQVDLVAIDDVQLIAGDLAWETALFHLFNRCRERGTRLLFSADRGPASLPLHLADLRSRLAWGLTLALQPLDDAGRLNLLKSLAERRALTLDDKVARFVLDRAPRHPRALAVAIERLDRASLAEQRRVTIPFVREQLGI